MKGGFVGCAVFAKVNTLIYVARDASGVIVGVSFDLRSYISKSWNVYHAGILDIRPPESA